MRDATGTSIPSGAAGPDATVSVKTTDDASLRLASLAIALTCLVALWRIALVIPLHLPLNYNEGWNAYHAVEVARGDPLYPAAPRFFFNNYPPLSFYLTAAALRVVGDPIVAGRWLSLAAFAIWTLLLARTAGAIGCRSAPAWFAALLFAANTLVFTDYVGIDDPQMIGQLIAAFGLLAVAGRPRTAARAFAAGLLLTIALFVKHNLIVLPVACFVWLLSVDRRAAWRLLTAGVVAALIGAGACAWAFGPGFFQQLAAPRTFLLARAAGKSSLWLARMVVPVSAAVVLARRFPRDEGVAFCTLYAGLAIVAGIVSVGGDGVNWNVFLDATWALCLTAAVALDRLRAPAAARFHTVRALAAAYTIAPAIALALSANREWLTSDYWLQPDRRAAEAAASDVSFIAGRAGHALCEELALCFWAGKPVEVDVYNTQQRIRAGTLPADELAHLLDARYFAVVQLDVPTRRLGAVVDDALARDYRLARERIDRRLFVPR